MNDLVVANREHEFLVIGIEHRESQLAVVILAIGRVFFDVLKGVVHPAHVPLEAIAQAAAIGRRAHAAPTRRFLGNHHHARVAAISSGVYLLHERNSV